MPTPTTIIVILDASFFFIAYWSVYIFKIFVDIAAKLTNYAIQTPLETTRVGWGAGGGGGARESINSRQTKYGEGVQEYIAKAVFYLI